LSHSLLPRIESITTRNLQVDHCVVEVVRPASNCFVLVRLLLPPVTAARQMYLVSSGSLPLSVFPILRMLPVTLQLGFPMPFSRIPSFVCESELLLPLRTLLPHSVSVLSCSPYVCDYDIPRTCVLVLCFTLSVFLLCIVLFFGLNALRYDVAF